MLIHYTCGRQVWVNPWTAAVMNETQVQNSVGCYSHHQWDPFFIEVVSQNVKVWKTPGELYVFVLSCFVSRNTESNELSLKAKHLVLCVHDCPHTSNKFIHLLRTNPNRYHPARSCKLFISCPCA